MHTITAQQKQHMHLSYNEDGFSLYVSTGKAKINLLLLQPNIQSPDSLFPPFFHPHLVSKNKNNADVEEQILNFDPSLKAGKITFPFYILDFFFHHSDFVWESFLFDEFDVWYQWMKKPFFFFFLSCNKSGRNGKKESKSDL